MRFPLLPSITSCGAKGLEEMDIVRDPGSVAVRIWSLNSIGKFGKTEKYGTTVLDLLDLRGAGIYLLRRYMTAELKWMPGPRSGGRCVEVAASTAPCSPHP